MIIFYDFIIICTQCIEFDVLVITGSIMLIDKNYCLSSNQILPNFTYLLNPFTPEFQIGVSPLPPPPPQKKKKQKKKKTNKKKHTHKQTNKNKTKEKTKQNDKHCRSG